MSFPSSMLCALSGVNYQRRSLFPPQDLPILHQQILYEIREGRVASSRGRANPRGVKRKMSNYKLRSSARDQRLHMRMEFYVQVLK